jgi:cystathionine gamma-synthase
LATRSVRAGLESDAQHGSVVPPIYLSTNFAFEATASRASTITRAPAIRRAISWPRAGRSGGRRRRGGDLHGSGRHHADLATLPAGARVVAPYDCYGGTYRLLAALHAKGEIGVDFVDQATRPRCRRRSRSSRSWCGSRRPAIRLLRVVDIRAIAEAAHAVGALVGGRQYVLVAHLAAAAGARRRSGDAFHHQVFERPQRRGRRRGDRGDEELHENLAWWANAIGVTGAPFDSFLTLRGVRSLHARMRVHAENTAAVVELLTRHPAVQRCYYPGLADHPATRSRAASKASFGAMLSFELAGGEPAVAAFLAGLECFTLAESSAASRA